MQGPTLAALCAWPPDLEQIPTCESSDANAAAGMGLQLQLLWLLPADDAVAARAASLASERSELLLWLLLLVIALMAASGWCGPPGPACWQLRPETIADAL